MDDDRIVLGERDFIGGRPWLTATCPHCEVEDRYSRTRPGAEPLHVYCMDCGRAFLIEEAFEDSDYDTRAR